MALSASEQAEIFGMLGNMGSVVKEQCIRILQEEITRATHVLKESYDPTNKLANSVIAEVDEEGVLTVHMNWDSLDVYSNSPNSYSAPQWVDTWVNEGHTDNTGIDSLYHSHPATNFMESACYRVKAELGLNVMLVKDGVTTLIL
jgi:hypothetical protein